MPQKFETIREKNALENQGEGSGGGSYGWATAGSGAATDRPQATVLWAGLWLF